MAVEYHSLESEQSLIGAVLMNNAAFEVVDDIVQANHFSEAIHREIWEVCASLIGMGKLCSPLTIRTFLRADIEVGTLTLQEYLAALAADAASIINAGDFARIIRDLADRRLIIEVGQELQQSGERDNLALAAWGVDYLDGIVAAQSMSGAPALDMDAALARAVDAAATAYERGGKIRGLSYGLRELDARTLGAAPGQLIVVGGRSSMGKSAMALSIARNFGLGGHRTLFFSLEMGDVDLTTRMISDEMFRPGHRMSYWQIASGRYHESKFQEITDAAMRLRSMPIRIEQQPGLTVAQIGARSRQYKRRHGLAAIMVDHLGLVKASGRYAGNRVYEIGEITGSLKELAKELGIPVILLAQLNRGLEARDDKRPTMADLRSSGDIEQDADTIMLLYRPAYYLAKKEPAAGSAEFLIWTAEMEKLENVLEIGIEKQRSGPTGRVKLFVDIGANAIRDEVSEMDDATPLAAGMGDFR